MALPKCSLRHLEQKDIEQVRQWRNQEPIRRNMYSTELINSEQQQHWFNELSNDQTKLHFLFLQDGLPVGCLNYNEINDGEAKLGYYLGEQRIWPGLGLILELTAIEYAFKKLKLNCLLAEVLEFNTGPQRIHDLFGFEQVGILPEATWRDDSPIAAILFSYRSQDWLKKKEKIMQRLPRQIQSAAALLQL
ncbi:MAG: UDP-4-amino-4,6-dideoxy-N-acetyl-beta-L-altrosamine N-acetyltransferase [Geopsychrobacter sp.]|nr:UDP-4-amino-4,6-dideoxy-N-acetyl-beta-L-altrosamine N-acetyltransferase [Geopsychrobacter sp.]